MLRNKLKKLILSIKSISYNSSGVSLVELIVVVAIMSVLIGGASIGLGMVATKPATQCASNIEICLNRCRTQTLGKNNGFIALYADSNGDIYMVEKLGYSNRDINDSSDCAPGDYVKNKIGKKGVTVTCGGHDLVSNHDKPYYYDFERSVGSFVGCTDSTGAVISPCDIVVKKGSRSYTITIQKLTGKVILSKS